MSDSHPELSKEFIIKVIMEELPKLVKESDPLKGAIISALSGVMPTKEDIENLGKQMIEGFREMDKRFEAMQKHRDEDRAEAIRQFEMMEKRFEAMQKHRDEDRAEAIRRFEMMEKRFEAMQKQREEDRAETIRRFEMMDKRFEAMQKQRDEDRAETIRRFEMMDKRFEAMQKQRDEDRAETIRRFEMMDKRFENINSKLDHLIEAIGKPFEQFGRNVIMRILEGEGIKVNLVQRKFPNPYMDIFESNEIELDGFSENPAILVEITTIVHHKEKIEKFVKKKKALEKIFGKSFRGFFVCSNSQLTQDEKAEMIVLLKQNNSELINL